MSLTITGLITLVLSQFLPLEEVSQFVDSAALVITSLMIWYGRYRQGDISLWGVKK